MREGTVSRNLFWLTDEHWAKIAPLLPSDVRGKPRVDDRRVISGILHVLKCGCRTRPAGKWQPHSTVSGLVG
jgi:transposase